MDVAARLDGVLSVPYDFIVGCCVVVWPAAAGGAEECRTDAEVECETVGCCGAPDDALAESSPFTNKPPKSCFAALRVLLTAVRVDSTNLRTS